jgi:transcriptional regulator with XRE-family HTH domain
MARKSLGRIGGRAAQDIDAHVGGRVRGLREKAGMSQGALAERLHLSFQQVQKYEQGKNRIGASRLYEFSEIFGVEVEYFFEGLGVDYSAERDDADAELRSMQEFSRSKTGAELVASYLQLTPETRRELLQLLRLLGDTGSSL